MNNLLHRLILGSSATALVAAMPFGPALAQNGNDIEQVVVSASRINIAGYSQPTPVTVVGLAQIEQAGYGDIIDALNDIPSVQANQSSISASQTGSPTGNQGADLINLRQLGNIRTLVLFDSQRFVMDGLTSTQSGYDVSVIPSSVITRVDIVTGGASAAWGSDAVAGVVNFVIDKNITGFKATVEGSDTYNGLDRNLFVSGTWGSDIFGGRGHVEVAATANILPDTVMLAQEQWFRSAFWVSNPAYAPGNGKPQLVVANNVGYANETYGGIINASPAGVAGSGVAPAAVNALRGIQFTGAGVPSTVNYGNVTLGSISNGGSLSEGDTQAYNQPLASRRNNYTFFGYGRYKITDTIQASVQLNAGYSTGIGAANSAVQSSVTIRSDNAYIPAAVLSAMQNGGISSFTLGTLNLNNFSPASALAGNYAQQVAGSLGPAIEFSRHLFERGVFSLDGTLGDDWSWNAYAQSSENRSNDVIMGDPITPNLQNAEDAVTVTAANVGKSGLALGSVACRTTLTGTTVVVNNIASQPGCVPLDLFGTGVASPAAIAYVTGASNGTYNHDHRKLEQDVVEASAQGTLPWELPAGKIAVAFGVGYRREYAWEFPNSYSSTGAFVSGSFAIYPGVSYNVLEGFGEVDAPILKNNIVESLDFTAAGRMTSYSTSGLVETWKLGATSQVIDDIKLRTTYSVDIRAPNLGDLYNPGSFAQISEKDPKTQASIVVVGVTTGNPNLLPEVGRTVSGGVVLTPTMIPGLSLSADWYSINVTGEISTIAITAIIQQCDAALPSVLHPGQNGNPNDPLCSHLQFNGPGGAFSAFTNTSLNIASQTVSGLDLQANYTMDFLGGSLAWASTDNYNDENTLNAPASPINDVAGSNNSNGTQYLPGPKWKGVLSATYTEGVYSFAVQTRWFGTSKYTNLANTGNLSTAALANLYDPSHFEVPFAALLDLRGSYRWNDNIQFFGAIDNTLNTPPPLIPNSSTTTSLSFQAYDNNVNLFPMLGRTFRVGVRFNY